MTGVLAALVLVADGASAQASMASPFEHTCVDCHMRDHDYSTGSREAAGSRVAARAMTTMMPGLSIASANCLECHSTEEQRGRRNADGNGDPVPLRGGAYLGLMNLGDHPLGTERRGTSRASAVVSNPFDADFDARDPFESMEGTVNCADCHDPHAYDLLLDVSSDERTVCLECHDPTYYAFQEHLTPSCGDCHQQHGAPGPALTAERDLDALCAGCHRGTGRATTRRVDQALYGPPSHDDLKPGRCVDCHKVHGDPGGR
ncbi:MAG TPA: cytochrome c3 family protein [Longimicrobiales bacterium]|nr:cytochrome c3 family protein [Longimicrobiales bacterium]